MAISTYAPEVDGWVRGSAGGSHANAVAANGSFSVNLQGNTAYVSVFGTYFCARTYYRFDTTGLSTDAVISSAHIQVVLGGPRGSTGDATEVHKLFKSSDNSSSFGSSLYQTITSTASSTAVDVGNTDNSTHNLTIDGDLLTYLKDQVAAGAKPAFLLRNKGDYDVATEGNPTGVNTRAFDGTAAGVYVDPFLSITYTEAAADNAVFFGTNF